MQNSHGQTWSPSVKARTSAPDQESRLAALATAAPVVLFTLRLLPSGELSLPCVSPACQRLLGVPAGEALADPQLFLTSLSGGDLDGARRSLLASAASGQIWRQCWAHPHPPDAEVWLEVQATPAPDEGGGTAWDGVISDVTHHVRDREARAEHAESRRFVESLSQVGWTCTSDGRDEYNSQAWLAYTGLSDTRSDAGHWLDHLHPDDRETADLAWKAAAVSGNEYRVQCRIRRFDGVYRWFEVRGRPLRDSAGNIVRWFGTTNDIHEELVLRERLRVEQERLASVATVSPAVIHSFRVHPDGRLSFPYASPSIEALYGATPAELAQDPSAVFARMPKEDVDRLQASTAVSARHLTPWREEFRVHHPTRGEIWIEGHTAPVRDADGGTTWHGVLVDITARKRMEHELQLRSDALETSLTAFAIVHHGKFLYANRTYLDMWGYDRLDQILGTSPSGHCTDPTVPRTIIDTVAREGRCEIEFEALRRDGSTFQVRMEMQSSDGGDGVPVYFGTALDVSEELRAQANIRQWADAFMHCGHGIAMGSTETNRLMACNPAFARLVGRSPADLEGRPILELYPPHEHERMARLIGEADQTGRCRFEAQYLRPDGIVVDVQVDLVTVKRVDGTPLYRVATAQSIGERKMAEESLRVTRDQLQAIDRASPVPIIAISPTGTVFHWNPAAEKLFGWRAEEVLGHQLPIVPTEHESEHLEFRRRVVGGESFSETTQRRTRDGRLLDVRISTSPLYNEDRSCLGFVALYVDLTEQKSLERALQASEKRFSMAFEASPTGSILIRASDQRIVEINQAMERLSGYPREQVIGRTTADLPGFVDDGTRARVWDELARLGRVTQIEYPFRRADGEIRQAQVSAEVLRMNDEDMVLGVLQDVTEWKQAEQALRESEERLRLFIEHAPASLAMLDRDMRYLSASHRWLADYGLRERSLVGLSHYEVFPEIGEQWKEIHRRALAGEVVRADADSFTRADGTVQVLRWEVRPWRDQAGEVGGILIFSEDITASLKAQAALGESEARFRQLAESIHEVFWLTDIAKGTIVYISPGYEAIWGRSCQSLYLQPRDWIDAIHPEDRARVMQAATTKQVLGTYDEEYRIVRPDGSIRWVRDRAFPVRGPEGGVTGVAGVAEDITERRQLEAQVRQTQKMESVGLLAGGVAHDFNNWLTVISGSTELLMMETPETDTEHQELLQEIKFASERATALTRQLLAFSRREVVEPKVMDLNAIILDTEKMLRRLLGEDVQLETSLAPGLARVRVDPGQWTQVLMNLAVNARDAMPTGGRLTMSTRMQVLDSAFTQGRAPLRPGEYIVLTISDTGSGMTPEVRSRVFEPFFTTKGMGKGTGLGLAVVHGIVSQSSGYIELGSEIGVGTTFTFFLPVADEVVRGGTATSTSVNLKGTETLLLVEDEESIRRVAGQGLRAQGYTVLQAGDGEEALRVLEKHGRGIDLLVTDVVMPRMSGRVLAETLKARYPNLKVLYTSGYTDDAVVRHGIQQAEVAFLSKPYTPLVLLRKIRQVLESPESGRPLPSEDRPRP